MIILIKLMEILITITLLLTFLKALIVMMNKHYLINQIIFKANKITLIDTYHILNNL